MCERLTGLGCLASKTHFCPFGSVKSYWLRCRPQAFLPDADEFRGLEGSQLPSARHVPWCRAERSRHLLPTRSLFPHLSWCLQSPDISEGLVVGGGAPGDSGARCSRGAEDTGSLLGGRKGLELEEGRRRGTAPQRGRLGAPEEGSRARLGAQGGLFGGKQRLGPQGEGWGSCGERWAGR